MFSHVRPVRVATATFANSRACSGLFAARVARDEFVSSCLVCENFFFGANFGLVRDFVAGGTFAIAGCACVSLALHHLRVKLPSAVSLAVSLQKILEGSRTWTNLTTR